MAQNDTQLVLDDAQFLYATWMLILSYGVHTRIWKVSCLLLVCCCCCCCWETQLGNLPYSCRTVRILNFSGIEFVCVGCFEFYLCKILAMARKIGDNLSIFSCKSQFCEAVFGLFFYCCLFFLRLASFWGDYGLFISVPLKETKGILDYGIAVLSYVGIEMWISWTLGLQSVARTSTNKQVIQLDKPHLNGHLIWSI